MRRNRITASSPENILFMETAFARSKQLHRDNSWRRLEFSMSTISLRLPESLHKRVKEIAKREGVSINQLINSALTEKISVLLTEEYLEERAKKGNRGIFEKALAKVQDIEPDRLLSSRSSIEAAKCFLC